MSEVGVRHFGLVIGLRLVLQAWRIEAAVASSDGAIA